MLGSSIFPALIELDQVPKRTSPRIAIIGAGMAGLTAAWHLEKSGLQTTLYESAARTGGRILSGKNIVGPGITTEMGGEFIDSNHTDILSFCRAFNLALLDTKTPAEKKLTGTDYSLTDVELQKKRSLMLFVRLRSEFSRMWTACRILWTPAILL